MIYNVYGFFSCLPLGNLATHSILALIINRRYYLCIGIKMDILNSATYTVNVLPRSASANSPSIKLSHAEQYVA